MKNYFELAARADRLGVTITRLSLIVVLLWIGGLKVFKYEADGIVPFVANSPFMSFPTISLTAALGLQSVELNDLFDAGLSRTWRFAPQVVGPIFNAGRISAGVQVAKARQQAALAAYEQSIQNGFREVEDALVSIQKFAEQLDAQDKHVAAERARLELSELRYEGGVSSFSDVLDAQRFLFTAELTLAELRSARLTAVVQLFKALGGGWERASRLPADAKWISEKHRISN